MTGIGDLSRRLPLAGARAGLRAPVRGTGGSASWLAWSLGVTAYGVAVFQRASLGVAGIDAARHFGVGPALLSTLTILQLLVYAGMQLPVGLMVDRFGPRKLLCGGLLLMAVGQLAFATSHSLAVGVTGRVLLGCGDAMTFVSVLKLIVAWFPARRAAVMTQFTALVGYLGNLISAAPLSSLLQSQGWSTTFLIAAGVCVVALLPVASLLRDHPQQPAVVTAGLRGRATTDAPGPATPGAGLGAVIAACWARPGTRMGMWVHFTTQFSGNVFALLWGFPFLVRYGHLDAAVASLLISLLVICCVVFSQFTGMLLTRFAAYRFPAVLTVVLGTAASWLVVLCWPGVPPLWLLVAHIVVLGTNQPASMIGFDYNRQANPGHQAGTGSGLVNIGGFSASVLVTLLIGGLLSLTAGSSASFPIAFGAQGLLLAVGLVAILRLNPHAPPNRPEQLRASSDSSR